MNGGMSALAKADVTACPTNVPPAAPSLAPQRFNHLSVFRRCPVTSHFGGKRTSRLLGSSAAIARATDF